jgi:MFS family permease
LLSGTIGMAIALIVVAATFTLSGTTLGHTAAIVAVASLAVYTGSFAIGLGPVFWLLISEIYPARIRGKSMSIATIANWGRISSWPCRSSRCSTPSRTPEPSS